MGRNDVRDIPVILSDSENTQLNKMIDTYNSKKNLELEISYYNISHNTYLRVLQELVDMCDDKNITTENTLDVNIVPKSSASTRITYRNKDDVNKFITKNSSVTAFLIIKQHSEISAGEGIEIMSKDKNGADKIVVPDYCMAIKLTPEIMQEKAPEFSGSESLLIRYKNRYSFVIDNFARVDVTDVRESKSLWNISKKDSKYEIEVEFISKITQKIFMENMVKFLRIIQNSDIIIGKTQKKEIIDKFSNLLDIPMNKKISGRNVISMEIHHITKFIPNKYGITDKPDGDRAFMYIVESGVYLVSPNKEVKKLGIHTDNSEIYDTVLDGEFIDNTDTEYSNMYMAFDVIYSNGVDYRRGERNILVKRLSVLNDIIKKLGYYLDFPDYTRDHTDISIDKITDFYKKELVTYWDTMKLRLKTSKDLVITRKIYFIPYGIGEYEIFAYADMLWKQSTFTDLVPYNLDGIIYTPLASPYLPSEPRNLDGFPQEYKWKPPSQNSIDFYIIFEKDSNNQDIVYFDEAYSGSSAKKYKLAKLHVGKKNGTKESPAEFVIRGVAQTARIPMDGDDAVDMSGDVVTGHSVVEFIFDSTIQEIDNSLKWRPLRTRHDKTETVRIFKTGYGNYLDIAVRIWRTISIPITESSIAQLSDPKSYPDEMKNLSGMTSERKTSYYQKQGGNVGADGVKGFHNWIKSNMISSYCKGANAVLDIGCGRGGDLGKFYAANIKEYVGTDIDAAGLYTLKDSAVSRYIRMKKISKLVPPMTFINADSRARFNVEGQKKVMPGSTESNNVCISKYLSGSRKYDAINAQFTLHYYVSDDISWDNFCQNINDHISDSGYLMITTFDGDLIRRQLKDKENMKLSYTDRNGETTTFFDIKKKYSDDSEPTGTGHGIDVYNSMLSEPGVYHTEYLVYPDFLEKSMKEKCGLELVESDSFFNIFNLYRDYFVKGAKYSGNVLDKRTERVRKFYNSLDSSNKTDIETNIAVASFKLSILNKYYIFRKTKVLGIDKQSRFLQINLSVNPSKFLLPYLGSNRLYIDYFKPAEKARDIYQAVRTIYPSVHPNVYLIKDTLMEPNTSTLVGNMNMLVLESIKRGRHSNILLIYKSPDRKFYPIFYEPPAPIDIVFDIEYYPLAVPIKRKKAYLFKKSDFWMELDIITQITNLSNGFNDY